MRQGLGVVNYSKECREPHSIGHTNSKKPRKVGKKGKYVKILAIYQYLDEKYDTWKICVAESYIWNIGCSSFNFLKTLSGYFSFCL